MTQVVLQTPSIKQLHLLLLVALVLTSRPASANVAIARPDPAVLTAPGRKPTDQPASKQIDLHVVGERLTFECSEQADLPICDFRAAYRVKSRATRPQEVVGAFMGIYTSNVQVRVDGTPISHQLTTAEFARIDDAVQKQLDETSDHQTTSILDRRAESIRRDGFRLTIPPEEEVTLEAMGRVHPGRFIKPSYATDAVWTRHPLLGTTIKAPEYDLDYLVAPIRTWGSVGPIEVTMRYPASWKIRVSVDGPSEPPKLKTRTVGNTSTTIVTLDAVADVLRLHVSLPSRVLHNGGVMLGIGGTVDEPSGLRARLGYEVAAPSWLFHGVAVDTDFTDELVITPTFEAATSGILAIVPSLGFGLGVPIQIRPEVTAGIRLQLTLQWPFIGMVTSFDLYPGLDTERSEFFQATILAQVAL